MMVAEGFHVHDSRMDNLITISCGNATNYFYLFGGHDEGSQDLVQGITAAGAMFDEVALMPQSFVNQATGRCSVDGSKFWFNCNPESPNHWFKSEWIDKAQEKNLLYLHFAMDDNLSLSEDIKRRYRSMYSGVFYKRFILGQWSAAEGIVYDMFDEAIHTYGDESTLPLTGRRYIAVDYGTVNPMVFLDVWDTAKGVFIRREYYYDSSDDRNRRRQKTDKQYAEDMYKFIGDDIPAYIIVDPSAASFKLELKHAGYRVRDADNDVLNGIRLTSTLFNLNRLYIHKSCVNLINELHSYCWDEKAASGGTERPIKKADHCADALRYFCYTITDRRRIQ
jgi:PBSX family phage terminase large subunit